MRTHIDSPLRMVALWAMRQTMVEPGTVVMSWYSVAGLRALSSTNCEPLYAFTPWNGDPHISMMFSALFFHSSPAVEVLTRV